MSYLLCGLVLMFDVVHSEGLDPVTLAQQWAPKIYLSSEEQFWPGDVEAFLKEVTPQGPDCPAVVVGGGGLPTGEQSQQCFLTTQGNPYDLLQNQSSFLYGTKPNEPVPAYAYVKSCGPDDHLTISYWLFFPFNKGKDMCGVAEKIPLLNSVMSCKDSNAVVGNHVGDWEHLSVELKDGKPISLFLSVHDGGVYYNYDSDSNTFQMTFDLKEGLLKVPDPPKTITLEDGHPILYCAEGSHAVWAAVGQFSYSRVEMKELVDVTDKGPEWDTWQALKVFHSPETTPAWWNYEGHWGNQGSECVLQYCIFADGPKGLATRPEDFKC